MQAQEFLDQVHPVSPAWQSQGTGTLTWSVFSVYHATLWTSGPLVLEAGEPANPRFALQFSYLRNVSAESIVEASQREIARLAEPTLEQMQRWEAALRKVMPDARRGDVLWMIFERGQAVSFHHADGALGRIADPDLAIAMAHIWFHPDCHSQRLRLQLLKET